MNILECVDLNKSYKRNKPVLSNLNLRIPAGRIIGLLGPNGCGRTAAKFGWVVIRWAPKAMR